MGSKDHPSGSMIFHGIIPTCPWPEVSPSPLANDLPIPFCCSWARVLDV